jgi:protein TonB
MQSSSVIASLPAAAISTSPKRARAPHTLLFYAFLGSIAIHLGALAVFHLFPQRSSAGAADLDGRARGVQLVATIRLGVVDAVPNASPTPNVAPAASKPETPPESQPVTVAKAEPPPATRDATPAPLQEVQRPTSTITTTAKTGSSVIESSQAVASTPSSSEPARQGDLGTSHTRHSGGAFTTARADYLHNPPPRYPEVARQRGWQGVAVLRVQVRADGTADCVEILKTSGHRMLDKISVETVRGWKFSPARFGEASVASWVEVPIRFQLVSS